VKLTIVGDIKCSDCGSENVRSKVSTEEGCLFRCNECGEDTFVRTEEMTALGTAELDVEADNFGVLVAASSPSPEELEVAAGAISRVRAYLDAYEQMAMLDQTAIHSVVRGGTFTLDPRDLRELLRQVGS